MWAVLLPPGVNPIAAKYISKYQIKLLLIHFLLNPVHLALNTAEGRQQFTVTSKRDVVFPHSVIAVHSSQIMLEVHFSTIIIHPPLLFKCKFSVHHSFWGLHVTCCVIIFTTTTRYIFLKLYSFDSRHLWLCEVYLHLQHGWFDLNGICIFENNSLLSCMWHSVTSQKVWMCDIVMRVPTAVEV